MDVSREKYREKNAMGMREGGEGGKERKKTEFEMSCRSIVCRGEVLKKCAVLKKWED